MNSFDIVVDPHASKDLKKLKRTDPKLLSYLVKDIDSLRLDPFQGKPLKGNKKGCHSFREGDYRIIYEIYSRLKTIHIIRVGHRREIYQ